MQMPFCGFPQAEAFYHGDACSRDGSDGAGGAACCCGEVMWVHYFLHLGHLHIEGLKMSKSLKNFVTIRCRASAPAAGGEVLRDRVQQPVPTLPMPFSNLRGIGSAV